MYSRAVTIDERVSICHCAFEAKNNNEVRHLLGRRVKFGYVRDLRTANDAAAVLYVMSNMQECGDMEIYFSHCSAGERQNRTLIDILASKGRKLQVSTLDLSGIRLTVSSLQALNNVVRGDQLCKLRWLHLQGSLTSDADTKLMVNG